MKLALRCAALALTMGCAWQPGTGFSTVHAEGVALPAWLSASRLDSQGRWKLSDGSRVGNFRAVLTVKECVLESLSESGGSGGVRFDPANPPPGYTLCHGGHCHRSDGALIAEADIKAELAAKAGVASYATALTLIPDESRWAFALQGEGTQRWKAFRPHPHLAQVNLKRASLRLESFEMQGITTAVSSETVADAPTGTSRDRAWRLTMPLTGTALTANLSTAVSRKGPADLQFTTSFRLNERLLDGLPWGKWLQGDTSDAVVITPDAETLATLQARLLASTWKVQLTPKS